MLYMTPTEQLLLSYNNKVAWGNADADESLQDAINSVFSTVSLGDRADLYASLKEEWDSFQAGIPRKIFVARTIQQWNHRRVFGSTATPEEQHEDQD